MWRALPFVSTTQTEIPLPEASCCCHAPISCARAEASSPSTGTPGRSTAKAVMYIFIGPLLRMQLISFLDRRPTPDCACLLERSLTAGTIPGVLRMAARNGGHGDTAERPAAARENRLKLVR